jgi:hypothetical protein
MSLVIYIAVSSRGNIYGVAMTSRGLTLLMEEKYPNIGTRDYNVHQRQLDITGDEL